MICFKTSISDRCWWWGDEGRGVICLTTGSRGKGQLFSYASLLVIKLKFNMRSLCRQTFSAKLRLQHFSGVR